tara:strand:- start:691 stop:1122 length:432 start_codon:yes stop_codon:yes gene_type:complete
MLMFVAVIAAFSSCSTFNHGMETPNTRVELNKSDFSLSDQVSAEAKSVKILGIDFQRLFKKKTGTVTGGAASINLASIPVVGNFVSDNTASLSLYELMDKNPGYDVVFYPQYETKVNKPILGIGFLLKTTTVKTTARLGKLNK